MRLTNENYFSPEAEARCMGSTQFKRFRACEARALAILRGEWHEEASVALRVGSYVDAYFSGEADAFAAANPTLFVRGGALRAEYRQADGIIRRIERDPAMRAALDGVHQAIFTGSIEGVSFKIKVDSLLPDRIVDLKVVRDFGDVYTSEGHLPWIEAWGYDLQGAIYQEIERQSRGDFADPLPFGIAAATKEKPEPDIGLWEIPQAQLDAALTIVRRTVGRFERIKRGALAPNRCGHCDYCRFTKQLTGWVDYREDV